MSGPWPGRYKFQAMYRGSGSFENWLIAEVSPEGSGNRFKAIFPYREGAWKSPDMSLYNERVDPRSRLSASEMRQAMLLCGCRVDAL